MVVSKGSLRSLLLIDLINHNRLTTFLKIVFFNMLKPRLMIIFEKSKICQLAVIQYMAI